MLNISLTSFFARLLFGSVVAVSCLPSLLIAQSPPEPPAGHRWIVNDAYTDEFNGTQLDRQKWHDHNPRWKGRVPGKFMPSSVSVKDGFLQIKSTKLNPPDGEFTIACGAVQSKAKTAHYGYYECRMKASSISTSSTFWLASDFKDVDGGKMKQELDIQECIGNAKRFPAFRLHMNVNTHQHFRPSEGNEELESKLTKIPKSKRSGRYELSSPVDEGFHTYGCWWVDANTMKFYADGILALTVKPPMIIDATPFDEPMFMNLICETYGWVDPPTDEDLADDSRNTTYYDYVRSWKLTKDEDDPSTTPIGR